MAPRNSGGNGRERRIRPVPELRERELQPLSVEAAVRDNLADVPQNSPAHIALVATAITLARKLDEGAGMATAAVAKELRATLDAILRGAEEDDDGLDSFVNGLGLPAPMGQSPFS
jgi:hypothetical protein